MFLRRYSAYQDYIYDGPYYRELMQMLKGKSMIVQVRYFLLGLQRAARHVFKEEDSIFECNKDIYECQHIIKGV